MMPYRVMINGARGRMGQAVQAALAQTDDLQVVAQGHRDTDLAALLATEQPDIAIDFTGPDSVVANTRCFIEAGVHPVIGTTGFTADDLDSLQELAAARELGGIIAPNFSIAVALLLRFAEQAATHYPDVEITEWHHPAKRDAPSGTALETAETIARQQPGLQARPSERETIPHARGAVHHGIHIHAIRLPGLLAHEEVRFGGPGENLTLRHDAFDRHCFMPGVILACRKVPQLKQLVYGLNALLS